jgi:hypothetical protein
MIARTKLVESRRSGVVALLSAAVAIVSFDFVLAFRLLG